MGQDLPYFKFYVSEWLSGDITLEDMDIQGVFVNVCAYYWTKGGSITKDALKKKFKDHLGHVENLFKSGILKSKGERVRIAFLDEQLLDRKKNAAKNAKNGKSGGRPKKPNSDEKETQIKPTGLLSLNPKEPNIEEKRREERRDRENYFHTNQDAFDEISNNYKETEPQRNILSNRGWRSASKTDTDALLFHFLESQADLDTPKANVKNHFRKWLNKIPLPDLQHLAKTINERLAAKVS